MATLNNGDVLRLKNRINGLNSQVNSFYTGLNGGDPTDNQEDQIQQKALQLQGFLTELLQIIDGGKKKAMIDQEIAGYRS